MKWISKWLEGTWIVEGAFVADPDDVKRITIASDWSPLREYERIIEEEPLAVYGDLLHILQRSDLNVVNVECTLGTAGEPIPKAGPNFRGSERAVCSLTDVPFHVACMANNHVMDFGPDSLQSTLDILKQNGLFTIGAGMTGDEAARPLLLEIGNTKLAIINFAEGEACCSIDNGPGAYGFEPAAVSRQVQALKQEADLVIVIFHGGREYTPMPPDYVVSSLRLIAESGAAAVIAHHPHVPQGIEIYRDVPIVYSQGNFVFWQDADSFYRHVGYLVHLDVGDRQVIRMEITPYLIQKEGLSVMTGDVRTGFLKSMQRLSGLLADNRQISQVWNAYIDSRDVQGLARILNRSLTQLMVEPQVGAANLLNWFFTPAHREMFVRGWRRAANEQMGDSPQWARDLVTHWLNCRFSEGLELCKMNTVGKIIYREY